ncbi:hypothetical protein [Roseimicrobium sp. ORNL1]|uniref:hypothetical protein n=1 Tax=Roseimicrobium sp. ORNL1 TaxID=2711231 RepID=UPI0013E0F632|nr:hypothetical protein [Roseimicrobium sp. ORNL1]QIF02126.1 hypothetical protein G5S37_11470 [Roseimicrobium sp. ORNL1]
MRVASLILSLLMATQAATQADDLDVIADYQTTPQARGEAYYRLMKEDFTTYARKLFTLCSPMGRVGSGGPATKEPWNELLLTEDDRIKYTLDQLWAERMSDEDTHAKTLPIMLEMVEDESLGLKRQIALAHIQVCLKRAKGPVPGLPPLDELYSRLERIARDKKQPLHVQQSALRVILVNAKPDGYLDLAAQLSAREPRAIDKAATFFDLTIRAKRETFSEEASKKYVRLCFGYLQSMNDHQNAEKFYFATRIGQHLGIREVEDSLGPFAPNRSLPKYQKGDYKTNGYYQDTVDNAMKWWAEHKGEY